MDVVFVLFLVWLFVTCLGHLSWVVVRTIINTFRDEPVDTPPATSYRVDPLADIAAARRILYKLNQAGSLDEKTARRVREAINKLESPSLDRSSRPSSISRPATAHDIKSPHAPASKKPVASASSQPLAPDPLTTPLTSASATEHVNDTTDRPVTEPGLSIGEIIQSFLAAHNIRWGELAAGMLIVICSIGLVVSLWSPLVENYRVLPSLIFTAANAAIYAAGLYTLSRWKLRETSRAVLIIATLLVPLSVLAGLAAAGTSPEAVQLNDPITLIGIAIAGAIYLTFLWLGSKALVRSPYHRSMVAGVAAPVAMLPLIPALVRSLGASAGWSIAIATVVVLAASLPLIRRLRRPVTMGPAGGRVRLLFLSLTGFCLAITGGYFAFTLRVFELRGWMPVAIACIPAMIAMGAVAQRMQISARRALLSMTGAIVGVLFVSASILVLAPALQSATWMWAWAVASSVSLALVGWQTQQFKVVACATVPLGLAFMLGSPVWLGELNWTDISLWRRMVGGEPMVAALLTAIVLSLSCVPVRNRILRTGLLIATAGWVGWASLIAAVLTVSPSAWLGVVPSAFVTGVIVIGAVVATVASLQQSKVWPAAVVAICFAWVSVFRPLLIAEKIADIETWLACAFSIAACLLVLGQFIPRIASRFLDNVRPALRARSAWRTTGIATTVLAATLSVATVTDNWITTAVSLAVAAALLLWGWLQKPASPFWHLMQIAATGAIIVVGYGRFGSVMWTKEGWLGGEALPGWAILFAASAAVGWTIRESIVLLSRSTNDKQTRRAANALRSDSYAASRSSNGLAAIGSVLMLILSAAQLYGALLISRIDTDVTILSPPFIEAAIAAVAAAAVCWWYRRFDASTLYSRQLLLALSAAAVVWCTCAFAISTSILSTPTDRIIAATSLSTAIGLIVLMLPGRLNYLGSASATRSIAVVMGSMVGLSSLVLVGVDWRFSIMVNEVAEWALTGPVALWWAAIAVALMMKVKVKVNAVSQMESEGKKTAGLSDIVALITSAFLFSAAAALASTSVVVSVASAIQIAAIAMLVWIAAARGRLSQQHPALQLPINLCTYLVVLVGVTSALLTTASTALPALEVIANGPAGFIVSLLTVVLWCVGWLRPQKDMGASPARTMIRLPWPIAVSLLAGQFAWLASAVNVVPVALPELAAAIAVAAAIASVIRYGLGISVADGRHVTVVAVCVFIASLIVWPQSTMLVWLAIAAISCVGMQTALLPRHVGVGSSQRATVGQLRAAHVLQWLVILGGGGLLLSQVPAASTSSIYWTILVAWASAWVLIWRTMTRDRRDDPEYHARVRTGIADKDWAGLLMLAVVFEVVVLTLIDRLSIPNRYFGDQLVLVRVIAYALVAASGWFRLRRTSAWTMSVGTAVGSIALICVQVGVHFDRQSSDSFVAAVLPAAFMIALFAHWISRIGKLAADYLHEQPAVQRDRMGHAVWQIAALIGVLAGAATVILIDRGEVSASASMCAAAVALVAWAIGVTAESRDWAQVRKLAVAFALASVALLSSIDQGLSAHPLLTGAMRWLVAAVFTIPMLLFAAPAVLGRSLAAKWYPSLRQGAAVTAAAAVASLVTMLGLEAGLREEGRIAGLPLPLVIGVAVVLGLLSLLAALVAILSGPRSSFRQRLPLTDLQRRILIVLAQVIAVVTWLHVYLCDQEWAFAGLRNNWPYAVMGLAFVSVAVSEWARRREDRVLYDTLAQTALYLPLIPVAGFWLSGSQFGGERLNFDWVIRGEVIQYEWLLAVAAIYYVGVSFLWKRVMPRVAAIILANAAWWVVLVQQPGWQFLAHPQAWLIPPAACVLIMAHLYRERLEPKVASAIGYAATLVIYVSSTADMLVQQIGESLAGPIVLVLLALAGMVLGVILRVRPFLYLGATFVFIGVTSMVWHAHRSLDAVWPWWVFGITTGILILIALMAIEKNKSRLHRYSETLATWH